MAVTTLAGAKAEIYGQITSGGNPSGVTEAYDHERPPQGMQRPVSLAVSSAGMDPEFFLVAVRLYVDITTDAKTSQDAMDAAMVAIESKVSHQWGPSIWTVNFHPELDGVLVAEWIVQRGREDF